MQQNEMTDMKYAGFWFRVIAAIVDFIILLIPGIIIVLPLAVLLAVMAGESTIVDFSTAEDFQDMIAILISVIGKLISWLYFTVSESSTWQATLGKKMFGIRVTDMEGNKIGFGKANGRYWSQIISKIILLIGYIMVAFTEKKQGLHDIIAGTLVMKKA